MNDRDPLPRVAQHIKLVPMKDNEDDEKEVLPGGWVRMKKEGEKFRQRFMKCLILSFLKVHQRLFFSLKNLRYASTFTV